MTTTGTGLPPTARTSGADRETGGTDRPDGPEWPDGPGTDGHGTNGAPAAKPPTEPATGAAGAAGTAEWDLDTGPRAASRARDLTRRALREWRVTDPADTHDIVLIVDELVTNAVVHGAGPVHLALHLDGPRLTGEIRDAAPTDPHAAPTGALNGGAPTEPRVLDWSEAGRGLLLVAALATGYGARPEPSGKTVWFTRRLTGHDGDHPA